MEQVVGRVIAMGIRNIVELKLVKWLKRGSKL